MDIFWDPDPRGHLIRPGSYLEIFVTNEKKTYVVKKENIIKYSTLISSKDPDP